MESETIKIKLIDRFRMAWMVFWLQPFDIQLQPYHRTGFTTTKFGCDNHNRTGCKNKMGIYLEQTRAEFTVRECDSYILCEPCALKADGTKEKLDFDSTGPDYVNGYFN